MLDISEKSMELCKKRFEVFNLQGQFLVGDAEKISSIVPPNSKFDLIWSFGVIHHTPNPRKVIVYRGNPNLIEGH